MATPWFISKEFHIDNRSHAEKLTADTTGEGETLYKEYRDAALAYDEASKQFVMLDITEEQLQEKENDFVIAQANWAEWVSSQ